MKRVKEDIDFVWYEVNGVTTKLNKMVGRAERPDKALFDMLEEIFAPTEGQPRHELWREHNSDDWNRNLSYKQREELRRWLDAFEAVWVD